MAHRLAKRAEADLEDIAYYIAKGSGSLETGRRVSSSLDEADLWALQRPIKTGEGLWEVCRSESDAIRENCNIDFAINKN